MKNAAKCNFFLLILAVVIAFVIYSCSEDTVTTQNTQTTYDPYSINGTVTFVDTNVATGATYAIGAFSSWPPTGPPSAFANLVLTRNGNQYQSTYKIIAPLNGTYYISTGVTPKVLGIYGCDTVHIQYSTCPLNPSQTVIISNGTGVGNINFLSWADTSKKIF